MAGFVPMQGADAYTERQVPLHGDHVTLRVCEDDILDVTARRSARRCSSLVSRAGPV